MFLRVVIIRAQGEVAFAENMAKAASILSASDGVMHLGTLQSVDNLGFDRSNTVVFALPAEILRVFKSMTKNKYIIRWGYVFCGGIITSNEDKICKCDRST